MFEAQITKALCSSGFIVEDLRDLSTMANAGNNRALYLLAKDMLEMATEINQRLNELL